MLMRSRELGKLLKLSEEKKVSALRVVPSISVQMVKEGVLDGYDLRSIKSILCSRAKLKEDVVKRTHEKLAGAPIFQGYG